MKELFFLNGKSLDGFPPVRALFYGEGVFETFRWKESPPIFLSRHIERMRRGAEFLGIPFPGEREIMLHMENAVEQIGGGDLRVKVCLLGEGCPVFSSSPSGAGVFVSVSRRSAYPETVSLGVCDERRSAESSLLSHKTLNYLSNITARRKAVERGFDEVLFLNTDNAVTETSCHNIFWVKGKKLFTPALSCAILAGVTREAVLDLCPGLGYESVCGSFSIRELFCCDFVFVTNAGAGILYVRGVDGRDMPPVPQDYDALKRSLFLELGW